MSAPIYIGDEVSAAGYRLAGMRVYVPRENDCLNTLSQACEEGELIFISASIVQHIPEQELDRYLAQLTPAVVVVPDVHLGSPMLDLSTRLRRQLGVLE
jgi:vacuolar-type H+-ATPase subunit F/Vma7